MLGSKLAGVGIKKSWTRQTQVGVKFSFYAPVFGAGRERQDPSGAWKLLLEESVTNNPVVSDRSQTVS